MFSTWSRDSTNIDALLEIDGLAKVDALVLIVGTIDWTILELISNFRGIVHR